jgi:hypothetical protein
MLKVVLIFNGAKKINLNIDKMMYNLHDQTQNDKNQPLI